MFRIAAASSSVSSRSARTTTTTGTTTTARLVLLLSSSPPLPPPPSSSFSSSSSSAPPSPASSSSSSSSSSSPRRSSSSSSRCYSSRGGLFRAPISASSPFSSSSSSSSSSSRAAPRLRSLSGGPPTPPPSTSSSTRRRPSFSAWTSSAFSTSSPSSFSTSSSSSSSTSTSRRSKLAIGGSKLAGSDLDRYASVVTTALECAVTTFESGHGGERNLSVAYETALRNLERRGGTAELPKGGVTLTGRFGYRALERNEDGTREGGVASREGDAPLESSGVGGAGAGGSAATKTTSAEEGSNVDGASPGPSSSEADGGGSGGGDGGEGSVVEEGAAHNLSSSYVADVLSSSPLVELRRKLKLRRGEEGDEGATTSPPVNLIYLAHNPEAQGSDLVSRGAPVDEIREFVKERLTDAFVGLERGVEEDSIDGYGVCSNGLSLPSSHPMHLPWRDVLESASDAARRVRGGTGEKEEGEAAAAKLRVLQLPANLLETDGLNVAKDVKAYLSSPPRDDEGKTPNLPSDVDVFVARPLTCYPDRGTGAGKPFKLVDYRIPVVSLDSDDEESSSPRTQWTHLVEGSTPPQYARALNAAMSHFDATRLLEAAQARKLSAEERETLDGCRLLQSMMHDLDANLGHVTSFARYEEELYEKVVPLIHDTFEGLDEDSADVLQAFFAAHGAAVRHAVARSTRSHLREGGDGVPPYDVPDDWTLQRYALDRLLRNGHVSKIVVGCPKPDHVREAVEAADGSSEEEATATEGGKGRVDGDDGNEKME